MKKETNAMLQGLLDSKKECMEYLSDCFTSAIVECFQRMYKECLNKPEYKNGKNILVLFQNQLAAVPGWNQSMIMDEYQAAMDRSCCTYIPALIKATLVVHVKVHLMTNYSSIDIDKIKLRVPSAENFYHRCLIICASELWRQPYLLYHKVRSIEQQHNLNEVESIAKKSIKNAIRVFIPIDQLLSNIQLTSLERPPSPEPEPEPECDADNEDEVEEPVEEEQSEEVDDDVESEKGGFQEEQSDDEEAAEEDEQDDEDAKTVEEVQEEQSEDEVVVKDEQSEDDELHKSADESEKEDDIKQHEILEELPVKTVMFDTKKDIVDEPATVCAVDKVYREEVEPETQDVSTKKVVLGSMLINKNGLKKNKVKKLKPIKIGKSDSFF